MAIVPRARYEAAPVGVRQVVPYERIVAPQTGIGNLARGVSDVGTMFSNMQDDIDTAAAKNADSQYSNAVRQLLYEDGTGFMNRIGANAINEHQDVTKTLEDKRNEILSGLNETAKEKAQPALEGRYQAALQRVDSHASGQRLTYLNDAANARVESAINDAIYDPEKVQQSIQIAISEARDAGARNGSSPEVINNQIAKVQTQIHSGIIKRLSAASPIEAMRYLQDNKTKMLGSEVARLTLSLAPAVKDYKGRMAGQRAFNSGQVAASYLNAIKASESGGNDSAKNPRSSAIGRYQFIQSTWDELRKKYPHLGLTADGRFDPAQQEIAIRAFTADNAKALQASGISPTHGNLYAAHFLGAGDAKRVLSADNSTPITNLVSSSVINANPFLKGMTVASFKDWANKKGGGSDNAIKASQGDPIQSILNISDPDERASALREYKLLSGARERQQKEAHDQASDNAFRLIESGGSVDDLSLDDRQNLGIAEMSSLRAYQDKVSAGEKIETDPELYVKLSKTAGEDPNAFIKLNPVEWRDKLDNSDFEKFVDLQRKMRVEGREAAAKASILVDAPTISELRTASSSALKAAGITAKDSPKAVAQFERQLMQWADAFTRKGNKTPTPLELNDHINRMLTPVMINPSGILGFGKATQEGSAFQIDYDGNPLDPDDDLTLADVRGASIKINGQYVKSDMLDRFIGGFKEAMGRNPTAKETVEGLIESGVFN